MSRSQLIHSENYRGGLIRITSAGSIFNFIYYSSSGHMSSSSHNTLAAAILTARSIKKSFYKSFNINSQLTLKVV